MDELSKDELIDTIGNLKRQLSAKSIALQAAYSFIHGQFPEFAYEDIPRCIEHPSLLRPSSTQKQMDRQSHILSEVLYAPRLSETSVIMCIAAMEKMGPYFFSAWKLRIVVLHKKGLEYWSPPVNDSPQGATFQNCMSSSMKEHIKSLTGTGWRVGLETLGCRRMGSLPLESIVSTARTVPKAGQLCCLDVGIASRTFNFRTPSAEERDELFDNLTSVIHR